MVVIFSINHYVYPCGKASLNLGDASQILTLVRKYQGVDVYPIPLFFTLIGANEGTLIDANLVTLINANAGTLMCLHRPACRTGCTTDD